MFNELVLVHRKGGGNALVPSPGTAFFLPTCLRHVAVGHEDEIGPIAHGGDEIYRGSDAYRFFLEVICGLHSPLIGETEIFGQFKNALAQVRQAATPGALQVRRFLHALNEDAKRIRGLHLKDLGSQSYGSLLRRELKGQKDLHIIGAGQLVSEILPWICKDGANVHLHARNIERAQALQKAFPKISVHALTESAIINGALIIAAPLDAAFLQTWMAGSQMSAIVDLRGNSQTDQVAIPPTVADAKLINLAELFLRISKSQDLAQERKARALREISEAVLAREQHVDYRPFGWDDVCA